MSAYFQLPQIIDAINDLFITYKCNEFLIDNKISFSELKISILAIVRKLYEKIFEMGVQKNVQSKIFTSTKNTKYNIKFLYIRIFYLDTT